MGFANSPARNVYAILAVTAAAAIALIALFPQNSVLGVWKGYRVLAVSPEDCEDRVVSLLETARIQGYASESNSRLLPDGSFAPFQPQLASINAERSRWFSDGSARFFYLPAESVREKALTDGLDGLGLDWSLERHEGTSAFAVLSLIFALINVVLSANRPLTGSASVPFVVYALSSSGMPGFASALAALSAVALYGDLLSGLDNSLTKGQLLGRLRANPIPVAVALVSFAVATAGGIHVTVLFTLAAVAALSLAALSPQLRRALRAVSDSRRLHPRFSYLPIHPATLYRTRGPGKKTIVSTGSLLALALAAGLVARSTSTPKAWNDSLKRLSIPTPSGYTRSNGFTAGSYRRYMDERIRADVSESLPDLADFVAARWRLTAFAWSPIRSATPSPSPGDSFGTTVYSQDSSGKIVAEPNVVSVFDDAFVRDALGKWATPLERMLEKQGRFISVTRVRQDR